MSSVITVRWLGVAGIELAAEDYVLLIDPYLTRASWWQCIGRVRPDRALLEAHLPRANAILITHAHVDHLLDAPEIAQRTGATLYGSANTVQIAALCGLSAAQIVRIGPGDRLELGPFVVHIERSAHVPVPGFGPKPLKKGLRAPLRLVDYQMDVSYRLLIKVNRHCLLTDPGVRPDDLPQADMLFLYPHHQAGELSESLRQVRPRVIWLIHWDDMWRPLSKPLRPSFYVPRLTWPLLRRIDLDRLAAQVASAAPKAQIVVPSIMVTYTLEKCLVPHLLSTLRAE